MPCSRASRTASRRSCAAATTSWKSRKPRGPETDIPAIQRGAREPLFFNWRERKMAEVTAGMVRQLRDKTDAPMMECKKALAEAGGEMSRPEEILRVKLGNRASKVASRVTAEGVVA